MSEQQQPTVIRIDAVDPAVVPPEEPFKVTCTVDASGDLQTQQMQLSFLTDDARLLLCDHATDETPVETLIQVSPGETVSKSVTMHVRLRKGLRNEHSRDGSPAPLTLHARLSQPDGGRDAAFFSPGFDIGIADLAKRTTTKIFI